MSYENTLEKVIIRLDGEEKEKDKRITELESMLISRTKEVDDWILRYDKSVTNQRDIIHGQKRRIAELEKSYEELTIATLDAVQCMSSGKCKADLRDAYDKAVEQLKEQGK